MPLPLEDGACLLDAFAYGLWGEGEPFSDVAMGQFVVAAQARVKGAEIVERTLEEHPLFTLQRHRFWRDLCLRSRSRLHGLHVIDELCSTTAGCLVPTPYSRPSMLRKKRATATFDFHPIFLRSETWITLVFLHYSLTSVPLF